MHTSLDFQIIVQAVSEEWKVLGGGDAATVGVGCLHVFTYLGSSAIACPPI